MKTSKVNVLQGGNIMEIVIMKKTVKTDILKKSFFWKFINFEWYHSFKDGKEKDQILEGAFFSLKDRINFRSRIWYWKYSFLQER